MKINKLCNFITGSIIYPKLAPKYFFIFDGFKNIYLQLIFSSFFIYNFSL